MIMVLGGGPGLTRHAPPDAELIVVEDAGHLGGAVTTGHVLDALNRFATT